LFDLKGNVTSINKAAEDYGFNKSEMLGKNMLKFVSKRYWPKLLSDVAQVALGKTAKGRIEIRTPKGDRMAEHGSNPIFSENRVVGIQTILEGITERKKAEDQIKKSVEEWSRTFDAITDLVLIIDKRFRLVRVNKSVCDALKKKPEELIGKHCYEVMHGTDKPWPNCPHKKTLETKAATSSEISDPHLGMSLLVTDAPIFDENGELVQCVHTVKDISSRKKMEEVLRKSEAKYRSLVEQSMQGIVIAQGPIPHIAFANSAMQKILGYTVEELTSLSPQQTTGLVHPDDRELFFRRFKDRLEGKPAPPQYEVRGIRKDGSAVWLELSSARIEYGEQQAVQAIFTDITERRKAEEASRESEERFRVLAEQSPNMIFVNKMGKVVYANRKCEETIGYRTEELCCPDFDFITLIAPESIDQVKSAFRRHVEGECVPPYECTLLTKEGKRIHVIIGTNLITYNGEKNILGIITDITERKKVEQTLKESEKKYRDLVELAPDGIVAVNAEGIITSANRSFLTLVGCDSEEEIVGKPFTELETNRMEDIPKFQSMFKSLMKGESPSPSEFLYVRRDGTSRWAEVHPGLMTRDGLPVGVQAIMRDVTERKKMEKVLRDSEERLSTLFELAPDGYYVNDLKGNFIDGNKAAEEVIGYTKNELIGKSFLKLKLLPRSQTLKAAKLLAMNALGKPTGPDEFVLNRKDGTQVPVEIRTYPVKIKGKTVVLGMARDISRRKKDEQAVKESQQKFAGLFRHNPEATVYLDSDFRILDANPRFYQLFGYSAEETKGKNINDIVAPEDMREEAEGLDKDAKNGYASHNTVRKRKDGSLVPVSISAAPVAFENNLLGYVGIYKDITELKRAQEESEESKRHFQMLFDLMADPVAVVDGRGKILEVTRRVEEITGFKKEELVGKNLLKVKMFGAKTKAVMIKSLAKRMMGMHLEPYEVEVLKKDGGKLLYEINAAKIDYKGKPADLVVFRDIMERKNLEEKLRVVGSLTRHDVRNKLSMVTGNAYLLKRKLAGNPEALEQLADMENAVRKVEAIFEFTRTYEKLGVEQLVYVNVDKAVDEAVGLFPDLKGVKITNDCGGLTLLADSLLRQLFYNLIDDSLKYGEKLTHIRVRYEEFEDKLEVIYEDDGVGIPRDNKAKLFDEGFTTGKGSGYGLYLIRRMMEVYGWTISETGTHGKGAQFAIDIPKAKPDGRQNYKLS